MREIAYLSKRSSSIWMVAAAMLVAMFLPWLNTYPVEAGTLTSRSITMETSAVSATSVTYDISFDLAASQTLGAVVIDMCSNSPLIDTSCTAPTGFDWTTGGLGTVTGWTGAAHDTGATADDANTLVLSDSSPDAAASGTITIEWTAATNPSSTGTFYARIVTYDDDTKGDTYLSTDVDNGGAHTDDGGVALSTAAQISVTAKVQETLIFCVGTTDPGAACSGISGTSVDLGILSNSAINEASDEGTGIAYAQVTTNANGGVIVSYYGDNLKVVGETCGTTDLEGSEDTTDRCINQDANPDAGSHTAMVAGIEQWGMAVTSHPDDGTETSDALLPAAAYDYDAADEYAFAPNTVTTLASASGVVDSEQLNIDIAATINLTTPSGLYQTTLTFVATGTF